MVKKRKTVIVPKNPRKANVWESSSVFSTVEKASQILYNIQNISEVTGDLPNEMPDTEVPVILLQELCENYLFMYQKLLKEQLLITANLSTNPNIH